MQATRVVIGSCVAKSKQLERRNGCNQRKKTKQKNKMRWRRKETLRNQQQSQEKFCMCIRSCHSTPLHANGSPSLQPWRDLGVSFLPSLIAPRRSLMLIAFPPLLGLPNPRAHPLLRRPSHTRTHILVLCLSRIYFVIPSPHLSRLAEEVATPL